MGARDRIITEDSEDSILMHIHDSKFRKEFKEYSGERLVAYRNGTYQSKELDAMINIL